MQKGQFEVSEALFNAANHSKDEKEKKSQEIEALEWLDYVLDLDIIADAEYEKAIIRQRESNSDTYDEEIYTFEADTTKQIFFELWDESDVIAETQKLQVYYQLNGLDPDCEIDRILEQNGIDFKSLTSNLDSQSMISEEMRKLIDETKTIANFWSSQSEPYRQQFLNKIPEIAETLGVSLSVEFLLPTIRIAIENKSNSLQQKSVYRDVVFRKLTPLIEYLSKSDISAGYIGVRDFLLPLYIDYFRDIQPDQDHSNVTQQYKNIVRLLATIDKNELALPPLLDMLKDDTDEEQRVLGLQLLDLLAPEFGSEICQNYLMYEIVSLQDDPVVRVRKETCKSLVNISKTVNSEVFIGVLLPVFKRICSDHIWGVRKQAVETLPLICELAPDDVKSGPLLEIFKKFSKDQSKWVKQATTQFLGHFIIGFKGLQQSEILLQFYNQITQELLDKKSVGTSAQQDEDDLYHCAFNFPAVLLTLGSQSWKSLIPVYVRMTEDRRLRIRRTLSFSLHEVASLIDNASDLIPILEKLLTDVIEVKEGVLENLPEFISKLQNRETLVEKFQDIFFERKKEWRSRVQQAHHLCRLSMLIKPESFEPYLSVLFELCADEVSEVRIQACLKIWQVLSAFKSNKILFNKCLEQVIGFRQSKKYTKRQDFILICEGVLLNDLQMFQEYLETPFCELQTDPIVNVRIQLSQTLKSTFDATKASSKLKQTVRRLKFDSSRDISSPLSSIDLPDEIFKTNESVELVKSLLDQLIFQIA